MNDDVGYNERGLELYDGGIQHHGRQLVVLGASMSRRLVLR